jgi:hypothetical protein
MDTFYLRSKTIQETDESCLQKLIKWEKQKSMSNVLFVHIVLELCRYHQICKLNRQNFDNIQENIVCTLLSQLVLIIFLIDSSNYFHIGMSLTEERGRKEQDIQNNRNIEMKDKECLRYFDRII